MSVAGRAARHRRCADREFPPRHAGGDGPRPRPAARAQPQAHHRARLRLGQDGPYRERPGFGSLVEGMSGFAAKNGFADRQPVLPPLALADMIAGLYGVYGGDDRAARARSAGRPRPGDRPAAARPDLLDARPATRRATALPARSRRAPAAARRRPRRATPTAPATAAARHLRLDAGHGRAAVPRRRPRRHDRPTRASAPTPTACATPRNARRRSPRSFCSGR